MGAGPHGGMTLHTRVNLVCLYLCHSEEATVISGCSSLDYYHNTPSTGDLQMGI